MFTFFAHIMLDQTGKLLFDIRVRGTSIYKALQFLVSSTKGRLCMVRFENVSYDNLSVENIYIIDRVLQKARGF